MWGAISQTMILNMFLIYCCWFGYSCFGPIKQLLYFKLLFELSFVLKSYRFCMLICNLHQVLPILVQYGVEFGGNVGDSGPEYFQNRFARRGCCRQIFNFIAIHGRQVCRESWVYNTSNCLIILNFNLLCLGCFCCKEDQCGGEGNWAKYLGHCWTRCIKFLAF